MEIMFQTVTGFSMITLAWIIIVAAGLALAIIFRKKTMILLGKVYSHFIRWLDRNWTEERSKAGVLISVVMALIIYGIWQLGWFELLERKSLDWRYRNFRSTEKLRDDIVILDVDEQSIKILENVYGRFPWPRDVHGAMLQYMQLRGARCVAFDVLFSEPTQNPEVISPSDGYRFNIYEQWNHPDNILEEMTLMTGFVHHAVEFTDYRSRQQQEAAVTPEEVMRPFGVARPPAEWLKSEHFVGATTPLPRLAAASRGIGSMNMRADDDGPVRRSYAFLEYQGMLYPSISVSVIRQLASGPEGGLAPVKFSPGRIDIGTSGTENFYSIPIDENGIIRVHYYGDQKTYTYIPYYKVILELHDMLMGTGVEPETDLEDKIVLVGSTAAGLMDLRATPFSSIYPGVEVHANLINSMLEGEYLIMEPDWARLVLFLALAGLMGIWVAPRRAIEGGIITTLLVVGYLVGASVVFERLSLALDMVATVCFLGGDFIILIGAGYLVEERKRKQITGAFSQYVNPAVVEEILKDPEALKLGGEKKEISIFFSDLAGFTTISEVLTPEGLVALLNEYLTAMSDIILKYEGTIDKYEGDAIMAFFGAPLPQPDHAKRAVWASLENLVELDRLRKEWVEQGYPLLDCRIGLNTGEAVVGNMGSRTTKNYTAMGDTINLGARLESANKPYGTRLMISEFTYAQAKDFIEARKLDALRVKGKKNAVTVYEPMAKKGELTPVQTRLVQCYNEGMDAYVNQRWDAGIKAFAAALEEIKNDGPSTLYLERCRQYKEKPPGADWDGVFELTTK